VNDLYIPVKDYLDEADIYDYAGKKLVEWLLDEGALKEEDRINLFNPKEKISDEVLDRFYNEMTYDIILFSRKGNQYITNEDISLEKAKMICNSDNSKGANYFAGRAIHGSFPHAKEGEPFIIEDGKVFNPRMER
jgi:hypothetical protein